MDHRIIPLPTITLQCELGRCGECRGTIFSITDAHGRPCRHFCHEGDDEQVDLLLEATHYHEAA